MPECAIFKHGVVIDTTSTIRPCCAWLSKPDEELLYFDDDWQTRHAEWGKQSETEWLDGCAECKLSEEQTGKSLRTMYNKEFENEVGIKHWDLKINNTCNFSCRMCHPGSSSKWANLIRDNKEYNWYGYEARYEEPKTRWTKKALEFTPLMLDAKIIKFTGGEPLMIPQVKKIIQRLIDEDVSSNIELNLFNNDAVRAMQFDINFPNGFVLDNANVTGSALLDDFTITSSLIGENTYRFLVYTISDLSIQAGDNTILNLPISIMFCKFY